jgi:hypothetical protein
MLYNPPSIVLEALANDFDFDKIFIFDQGKTVEAYLNKFSSANNIIMLENIDDWRNLQFQFDLILCGVRPPEKDWPVLSHVLKPKGRTISFLPSAISSANVSSHNEMINIDLNLAYIGFLEKQLALNDQICSSVEGKKWD